MELTRLRGFRDLRGAEARAMSRIEQRAREIAQRYNFREIRIPSMERIELFQRSTGETSDIVTKQMYLVQRAPESAGRGEMVLRPEGTPGVVRAYIEAGFDKRDPEQRFFYSGTMLRYERPQKGRYREFWQFGVEVFGRADPACDAELLIMIDDLRRELRLRLNTEVNSLGCAECRPAFRAALLEYGRAHFAELCEDCHQRLERNPIRLLDCKIDVKIAESAPKTQDYLCAACRKHFDAVIGLIQRAGVPHSINPRLVRGLDYYTRTTFEVVSSAIGAQATVVAGGRYDGLVEELGGASVAGAGFAVGVDRMALALLATQGDDEAPPDAAVIAIGEAATGEAVALAGELRHADLRVEMLSPERRVRAQLDRAAKIGARYAVIIGEDELKRAVVQLKDLKASTQREVPRAEVAAAVRAPTSG